MQTDVSVTALEQAQRILGSECSPIGLMASPEGYPHVWARDGVITSLGALLSLRYQDSNGCGLLEVHEAADWADLLANPFNILYDNVLWYAALRAMAEMSDALDLDGSQYCGGNHPFPIRSIRAYSSGISLASMACAARSTL